MTTLTLTIGDQTEVKYGDVNGNGKVDSTDAAIVYRLSLIHIYFILCTEEQYPGATTFAPQNYSEAMQRLEV